MPWNETVSVYYSLEVINRLLGLVDARVAQVAATLGIPHLTLRPVLNKGLHHYYDHDHFTPAGAAVVARTVAAALLGRPGSAGRAPPPPGGATGGPGGVPPPGRFCPGAGARGASGGG